MEKCRNAAPQYIVQLRKDRLARVVSRCLRSKNSTRRVDGGLAASGVRGRRSRVLIKGSDAPVCGPTSAPPPLPRLHGSG